MASPIEMLTDLIAPGLSEEELAEALLPIMTPEFELTPAAAVADAVDTTDVVEQFNLLLNNLRAVSLLRTS